MKHLSDDQIDGCLIGAGSAEEREHLAECAECAARFDAVAKPMGLFREVLLETAHQPVAVREVRVPSRVRAWSLAFAAVAAALLIAVAVPMYRQRSPEVAVVTITEVDDDALLRQVQAEVSRSVAPPMQQLELLMASDTVATTIATTIATTEGSK